MQSAVVELLADNLVATWIRCPAAAAAADEEEEGQQQAQLSATSLHIRLRHLVLVLKNLGQHLSLEVQTADDRGTRRRFRFSTFQSETVVQAQMALLPLQLDDGWNQLQLDLVDLARRCYSARYAHTISVQLHASCRVRRVYFAEHMVSEAALPAEFRLYRRLSTLQTRRLQEQSCGRAHQEHQTEEEQ